MKTSWRYPLGHGRFLHIYQSQVGFGMQILELVPNDSPANRIVLRPTKTIRVKLSDREAIAEFLEECGKRELLNSVSLRMHELDVSRNGDGRSSKMKL